MRKHAKSWMMKLILGIIIVVFVFYFGAMRGDKQTETIAVIDGSHLTYAEFSKEYQNIIDAYRQRYGNNLTDDMLKQLNPRKLAFDNLANQLILLKKADEFKLDVSDEELKDNIFSIPSFQIEGKFNKTLYERVLRQNRITPEEFEVSHKKMLKIGKLERLIKESVKVSEKEVYDIYKIQFEEINAHYIKVDTRDFMDRINPSQEDLAKYLKDHEEDFRIPQKVQVKYISFPGMDFAGPQDISDEQINEYYNYNKDEFIRGKTNSNEKEEPLPISEVKGEIISKLRLSSGMGVAFDEAKKAHDIIYQEENLQEYAKENKLTLKTTEFFSAYNPPEEIAGVRDLIKEILDLKEKEITPVLSDARAHYIFGEVSTKPSYIPDIREVEKEVTEAFVSEEARKMCEKRALSILDRLKKGDDIAKVAKEAGLKLSETGMILAGSTIEEIGYSPEISEALYEISARKPYPDKVYYVGDGYVLLGFKEQGKLDDKDWEEKKDELKLFLLQLKEQKYFSSWLEDTKESMIKEGRIEILKDAASL
ncbi:MAG: SurA N-terminal domain-containing protein [Deltaproteobacteria bacterium]|nr:SurA N-terminal domain-containing protein [Deltaproteobacteria bacterium]